MTRLFGTPPGVLVGSLYASRQEAHDAGVHRPLQAGISGTKADGADSIVVSGGYVDDLDLGDVIVYTGHGGRDPNGGRQIAAQSLDATGNAGLITSELERLPVRVVRGPGRHSTFAPAAGYRYDGIYYVNSYWTKIGHDGFLIVQYRLERAPGQPPLGDLGPAPVLGGEIQPEEAQGPAGRRTTVSERIIRDRNLAARVKAIHDHTCQICRTRLAIAGRNYAEAAHIRALGEPHNGPDELGNLLCLCPNCHVRFDNGGFSIGASHDVHDLQTGQIIARLSTLPAHRLNPDHLAYHARTTPRPAGS